MPVHYLETGSTDPCYNLAFEQYVLEQKQSGDWLILWQNDRTVVVGLNQNTAEEINPAFIRDHHISVVRRMTGGGAVYHDLGNLNYSFITDLGTAEELTVRRFTEPVCGALAALGVNAQSSGRNDILVDGKKVSGTAQRIAGSRILHHGTLLFDSDPDMIAGALRADPAKFSSKSVKSVRSRVGFLRDCLPPGTGIRQFWDGILRELTADGLLREQLSEDELAQIRQLADDRYRSRDWTYGRDPDYSIRSRKRFAGGTLDLRMNIHDGRIEDIAFYGDFLSLTSPVPLAEALRGVRPERGEAERVLDAFDIPLLFGGITKEEILSLISGEED